MYTRRVARLRVSHSRRRCVQPLRASRNARDSHSRDAWAFKSSRWTHRQLPFRRDSPRRGETNRTGISLRNSGSVYPRVYPSARATNFRFSTRPRFRISVRRDFASAELRRSRRAVLSFRCRAEPLAHHGAAAQPAPDRARARRTHGRARSRGRSARRSRGSSRGARGRDSTRRTRDPSRAGHVVAALSAVSGRASRLLLTATGAHPSPTSRDGEG